MNAIGTSDGPPPAPEHPFMSDNTAGVAPAVMDALVEAASGAAAPYGWDEYTTRASEAFNELFGCPVRTVFCWGGTGANVVGLASLIAPWQSVLLPDSAHVVVDECGAPARFTGATITPVPTVDGKLRTTDLERFLGWRGDEHHPQPRVAMISQATEAGLVYQVDEIAHLCRFAHDNDMLVYVDGARIANAVVALGSSVPEILVRTGVDAMTFGLTKNGAMYGEAVIFINPDLGQDSRFVRKQAGQLASKGRYIAAQALALLADDLWLSNAAHANAMAQRLAAGMEGIDAVVIPIAPQANGVFAQLPRELIDALKAWSLFFDWDVGQNIVRWMTSHETTTEDVDRFIAGVEHFSARLSTIL